ncbi:activating transcription factor of chaperone-like [Haliotis cracherodii]|uniref:activating transcription factor of chaperone-like n=1 Tax=Haliotis cracherodii TaxID=6455 RepID=UPI0039EB48E5
MTSTLNMEDLNLLSEDWQLEPSLGLTLFDDPWKNVDLESTDIVKTPLDSGVDDLSALLGAQTDHIADPFCDEWMENVGITEMLQSLVEDSASAMDVSSVPETSWEAADTSSEVKGPEILRSLIEQGLEPESTPPSPEAQVAPTIDLGAVSLDSSLETPMSPIHLTNMDGIMHAPLSAEDVESLLSGSEPSSPHSSCATDVVSDASTCSELQAMLLDNTPKSNGKSRIRSSPYSKSSGRSTKSKVKDTVDSDLQVEFLSKKDKKKLQNKNAAIRYRQKKKAEAEDVKSEENGLEDKNKELHDKVDQLTREIQYMKDLMSEVLKAKGVKS